MIVWQWMFLGLFTLMMSAGVLRLPGFLAEASPMPLPYQSHQLEQAIAETEHPPTGHPPIVGQNPPGSPFQPGEDSPLGENIPWGATMQQVEELNGEPDLEEENVIGYQVQVESTPTLLGYHFDEQDRLFAVSLVFPKSESAQTLPQGGDPSMMSLVSEYGEPDGFTDDDNSPVWVLENGLLLTLVDQERTQALLLIKSDVPASAPGSRALPGLDPKEEEFI
jgi:hypothetical protein